MKEKRFKSAVLDHYRKSGRHDLPWRTTYNPYEILVSEIMLQQTQVSRVLFKYKEFLEAFPNVSALAKAPVSKVLKLWQGLGYNRRALNLKKAAEIIMKEYGGVFPKAADEIESLPGIGQSTRGAIMAFSYGIATPFIETNIRSVFIHHFFRDKKDIRDKDILKLVEKTLDTENPRDWYYALMDYGVHLKQIRVNPSQKSAHHVKQSPFKGSNREIRSRILRFVLEKNRTESEIITHIGKTPHDIQKNISNLIKEGFITLKNGIVSSNNP
jgi:A/G-specific adenine glycosylase